MKTRNESARAAASSSASKVKDKQNSDLKWSRKEKQKILSILKNIKNLRLPDDLMTIQRQLSKRSTAEIQTYLDSLLKPAIEKSEKNRYTFAQTNLKKWIDCCDRLSGLKDTCSPTGNGIVAIPHPGLSASDLFQVANAHGSPTEQNTKDASSMPIDWQKVHWFFQKVIEGANPFEEWSCKCKLESAVIIDLIREISQTAGDKNFDEQQEFFFHKSREANGTAMSAPYVEWPIPNNLFDSKFLNPLGLSDALCQSIREGETSHH